MMIKLIEGDLIKKASRQKTIDLQRFFKTGKGEYGEGDLFLGVIVPDIRKVVKKYWSDISLADIEKLLSSKYHEIRMCAVLMLVAKFEGSNIKIKKAVFNVYCCNTKFINNWDLVDLSAPRIVGGYLWTQKKDLLYNFVVSKNLWEKRIAVLATFYFIRKNSFKDALKISKILLQDKHDLMHKAVGWMLREVGNRAREVEETFLKKYYKDMPRTMLRYAIEKFPESRRKKYLTGKI
ncbi:MAG: DNA alkylation repair protein [Candidatus Portnoybacteria bacterium CG10_big_fil_rev_8_21_14_0_10_36_7]|uniref:DNA alkylation repair protein n=1 Tax=Candidatus Portnoybacteria bacterium CG10_big_fil_rev_8_21_14_0_10_36_7 TaxID=1974812 RepID=A0A2M8KE06_9BACT|nr:MAG: DNA alkylation repair protein [Candidatus Portnoybacteria bacterium CG10_big_fil_rev_8_21_14_0_10_36_7]